MNYADLDTRTRIRLYVDAALPVVRRALAQKADDERRAKEKPASAAGGGSLDPVVASTPRNSATS